METFFSIKPLEDFKTVTTEVFNNLCGSIKKHSAMQQQQCAITAAKQEFKQIIIDCNFDLDEVAAVMKTKSWDQDKVEHFVCILQERRIEILYALLTIGNSSHGETLTNFNWVLKLVIGSSELKSLKYPLVQLILHSETPHGNKGQKIYELNKEALNKFINVLENVE